MDWTRHVPSGHTSRTSDEADINKLTFFHWLLFVILSFFFSVIWFFLPHNLVQKPEMTTAGYTAKKLETKRLIARVAAAAAESSIPHVFHISLCFFPSFLPLVAYFKEEETRRGRRNETNKTRPTESAQLKVTWCCDAWPAAESPDRSGHPKQQRASKTAEKRLHRTDQTSETSESLKMQRQMRLSEEEPRTNNDG